jgi:NAD(P)-dependent dehydrogenase (short-subunit alcohol dehydrogenase family)
MRVWFITGGSSGLGLALVRAVLEKGDRVIATSRGPSDLDELVENYPLTARKLLLDVSDDAEVQRVVKVAEGLFDRIDVVVNNAGYGLVGAFEELGVEQIARNFSVNFFGALGVIRAVLPRMRAAGSGHIINISAGAVIGNYPGFSIYGATKWALEGVSESLAAELKPLGIKVTIVQPGPFRTDFIGRSLERGEGTIAEYARTSGKFVDFLKSMEGKQVGDPAKAAGAIIAVVEASRPPLRLVLGKYADDKSRRKLVIAEKELGEWSGVGRETDFDSPAAG